MRSIFMMKYVIGKAQPIYNKLPVFKNSFINRSTTQLLSYRNFSSDEKKETKDEEKVIETEEVPPPTEEDNLETKNKELEKTIKDLKDKLIRSYAEEENVRRIARRDVDNAKAFSTEKFAKSMLDVADNFERALGMVNDRKEGQDDVSMLKSLIEGIELSEKGLQKIFLQNNIVKYGAIGDEFNPDLHEALYQMPDKNKPANTIGHVLKPGYKLKDRVIRAAQTGTVVHP
jgi:molecular chaperone GrpE